MNTDTNLLFGVLALQLEYIAATQFVDVCGAWAARKDTPLAEILVERGWLTPDERHEIERLVKRKLNKHDGDPRKALGTAADANVRHLLRDVRDDEVEDTLSLLTPMAGFVRVDESVDFPAEERSHYTLSKVHSQGGLGRVWLARDTRLHRSVALKEIRPDVQERECALQRFVREAQITGQLEHPNIVPIYELGRDPEHAGPFYTMRFIEGRTLNAAIDEYFRVRHQDPTADALELRRLLGGFVSICQAISYAHSKGVLHRDLKPSNVMLGAFGEVVVLDWGLAKTIEEQDPDATAPPGVDLSQSAASEFTSQGQPIGTPPYMAPEQAAGQLREIDRRTDIYGLGAILFRILTGRRPHTGATSDEIVQSVLQKPTPVPRSFDPTISPALNAICLKAMAKRPADRYAQAAELADDVQRWLADEPVSAYQDPRYERWARWARKHRTFTRAVGTVVVAVALVAVLAAVWVNQARVAERTAKAEALLHFRDAVEAVDTMLTGVSSVLEYYPGTRRIGVRLLKKAAEAYEGFAAQQSADPGLAAESARAYLRLGDLYRTLNQPQPAEAAYRQAAVLLQKLTTGKSAGLDVRLESAICQWKLAELHASQNAREQAAEEFDHALRLVRQLPANVERALQQASILVGLAQFERNRDHFDQAIAALREAERELEQIDGPAGAKRDNVLALARSLLGNVFVATGKHREAIEPLQQASQAYAALVAAEEDEPAHLEGRAFTNLNLAMLLHPQGRWDEERQVRTQAIADYDLLCQALPDVLRFRENRAIARAGLAQLEHLRHQNREALQLLSTVLPEVRELSDVLQDTDHDEKLAFTCTTLGQVLCDLDQRDAAHQQLYQAVQIYLNQLLVGATVPVRHRLGVANTSRCLGELYQLSGQHEDAQREYEAAVNGLLDLLQETPADLYARDELAVCYEWLGDLYQELAQPAAAAGYYARALTQRRQLPADLPLYALRLAALQLKLSDPEQTAAAVATCRGLCQEAPDNPEFRVALGAAQVRAGRLAECIATLESPGLEPAGPERDLWLTLAYAERGQPEDAAQARQAFDRAVQRLEADAPGNLALRRLRAEAAQALGLAPGSR